jgi:4-amino-4-deoxy-L-arabinose transferase-like glycosyltransferase
MTKTNKEINFTQGLWIVAGMWLLGALLDRLWFALDHSVPAWDQADYLNGSLSYWEALKNPEWFNTNWWRSFWLISNKIPPLTYILTTPFINIFGTGEDAATLVMLPMSAILLFSVYGLGVGLFNIYIGLYAAILCQLLPGLYRYRLEFLLDYPLTTVVTLSFFCLTIWKGRKTVTDNNIWGWLWAGLFGLSLGLALMLKQTSLIFLLVPIVWLFFKQIIDRYWGKLAQSIISLLIALVIIYPWYRTNWLLIFTAGKRATIDSAIAEGDPALNTFDAWFYYGKVLPYLLSWHILIIPIVGLIIYWGKKLLDQNNRVNITPLSGEAKEKYIWLSVFLLGGYFLSSLNLNKDARYILPLLPVLSLILAAGLFSWPRRWKNQIAIVKIGLAIILMLCNLFPLGGAGITAILSPKVQHYPYFIKGWHHREVIEKIVKESPYQKTVLGVLPSTPEINQHNISYYGKQAQSQVAGRQVGVREKEVKQDARALDWFLTKTGAQGSVPGAQKSIVSLVENSPDFQLQKSWHLPDNSQLKLYHKLQPSTTIKPLGSTLNQVGLDQIIVPLKAPAGTAIPVTYIWSGSFQELQSGIVLLTWQSNEHFWIHDHGIARGELHPSKLKVNQFLEGFQVTETMAMLPDATTPPGNYTLQATYLDRLTGKTYPIPHLPVTIEITPGVAAIPSPELDLVTQIRHLAPKLAQGIKGLDPVFAEIARINQYDAVQDYLKQADLALSQRLREKPNRDWAYTIALARVLQQDVQGAIGAWQKVIELDSNNPYAYAYLAFVYLYDWQPAQAQKTLKTAFLLSPDLPILHALDGVAALMRGNLLKAWHELSTNLSKIG